MIYTTQGKSPGSFFIYKPMKLSQLKQFIPRIQGRNKARNALILLHSVLGWQGKEIAEKFGIDRAEISRIRTFNEQVLNEMTILEAAHSKSKRLRIIKRKIKEKITEPSKKDLLEWIEYERKEIEGERPLIEQHTHINYQWNDLEKENKDDNDSVLPAAISERNSQQQIEVSGS